MDRTEFERRMHEIDKQLAMQQVPALGRPILAWVRLAGTDKILTHAPPDPSVDPFEGPNLMYRIEEWYGEYYPVHASMAIMQSDWGSRLFLIRGEVFRARIPLIFNATQPLNAFKCIENLSEALINALDEADRGRIQRHFNDFYMQASDLALCRLKCGATRNPGLARELIERGWADLRTSCDAFIPNDPTAVMFAAQQATEKYLKAYLLANIPSMTEAELRNKYGHGIEKLLGACQTVDRVFDQVKPHIQKLAFGVEVRYQRPSFGADEVIDMINLSFGICHLVATRFLVQAQAA